MFRPRMVGLAIANLVPVRNKGQRNWKNPSSDRKDMQIYGVQERRGYVCPEVVTRKLYVWSYINGLVSVP